MVPHSAQHRRPVRDGFTIIELLIVITIIGILLTLTLRVVGAFITIARESATQTTIRKIEGLLGERSQALQRQLQRDTFVTQSPEYLAVKSNTTLRNASDRLQKICARKLLVRRYFPQSYIEISGGVAAQSNPEILYEMLTQSDALGGVPVGTDAFSSAEVQDTDLDGRPEFIDGWGRPLRFYRWPTRLFRSGGASGGILSPISTSDITYMKMLFSTLPTFSGNLENDLSRDPDDPLRFALRLMPSGQDFETFTMANFSNARFHTPATYHVMLVVSAGPDGIFGMENPDITTGAQAIQGRLGAVVNPAALVDDITYLNVRAGGK